MKLEMPKNVWALIALVAAILACLTLLFDAVTFSGDSAQDAVKWAARELRQNSSNEADASAAKAFESGGVTMLEYRSMVSAFQKTVGEDDYVPGEMRTLSNFVVIALVVTAVALIWLLLGLLAGYKSAGIPLCGAMLLWLILALFIPGTMKAGEWTLTIALWPFAAVVLAAGCAFAGKKSAEAGRPKA